MSCVRADAEVEFEVSSYVLPVRKSDFQFIEIVHHRYKLIGSAKSTVQKIFVCPQFRLSSRVV